MVLVDTDIMVDILRWHEPAITWVESLGDEEIAIPGYVVMELLDGTRDKKELTDIQICLQPYLVYWPKPGDCDRALAVFAQGKLSHGLSAFDALIGELAKGLDVPLHTFNVKHFKAIPGLTTCQPYERAPV